MRPPFSLWSDSVWHRVDKIGFDANGKPFARIEPPNERLEKVLTKDLTSRENAGREFFAVASRLLVSSEEHRKANQWILEEDSEAFYEWEESLLRR